MLFRFLPGRMFYIHFLPAPARSFFHPDGLGKEVDRLSEWIDDFHISPSFFYEQPFEKRKAHEFVGIRIRRAVTAGPVALTSLRMGPIEGSLHYPFRSFLLSCHFNPLNRPPGRRSRWAEAGSRIPGPASGSPSRIAPAAW